MRYSLRTLFACITIAAVPLGLISQFVEQNRSDWRTEQAAMLDGAVRWNDHTYIPNLEVARQIPLILNAVCPSDLWTPSLWDRRSMTPPSSCPYSRNSRN